MKKTRFEMRLPEEKKALYEEKAKTSGLSLSEWVLLCCDAGYRGPISSEQVFEQALPAFKKAAKKHTDEEIEKITKDWPNRAQPGSLLKK